MSISGSSAFISPSIRLTWISSIIHDTYPQDVTIEAVTRRSIIFTHKVSGYFSLLRCWKIHRNRPAVMRSPFAWWDHFPLNFNGSTIHIWLGNCMEIIIRCSVREIWFFKVKFLCSYKILFEAILDCREHALCKYFYVKDECILFYMICRRVLFDKIYNIFIVNMFHNDPNQTYIFYTSSLIDFNRNLSYVSNYRSSNTTCLTTLKKRPKSNNNKEKPIMFRVEHNSRIQQIFFACKNFTDPSNNFMNDVL